MTTNLEKTPTYVDGEVSYWFRDIGLPGRRPALPGDASVDVAIVGGGMTGLWTAYYLKASQPDLRIVVLEKEFAGFGASGRNGGWLSAEPPGQMGRYAKSHGVDSVVRLQQEMFASVDEVIRVVRTERLDAHVQKDGLLHVATTPSQQARLMKRMPALRRYGWTETDLRMISASELAQRVNVAGAVGAAYSPHCARIQPAMLVRGLADVVEEMGVSIYEGTEVTDVKPSLAVTKRGRVRADFVVRALEGFTAGLEGFKRTWLPMNSSMIVTEPLPESTWDALGWQGAELVGDEAHGFAYCQRTSDGRIALGGRAVPYRYGSRRDKRGETMSTTFDQLRDQLARLFPATRSVGIEHAWAGVLGVPRDWCASVGLDQTTGLGWAGGYVGHGVTSSNLAGRTLTDLVLQRGTDLVTLPWVGHKVRKWEVEPARWLAVRSLYLAYHAADRRERASGSAKTSAVASVADLISGRC